MYHYNRFIINEKLKKEASVLLQPILCKLNDILDKIIVLMIIANIKIDDSKSTILYTIDFFVLDVKNTIELN